MVNRNCHYIHFKSAVALLLILIGLAGWPAAAQQVITRTVQGGSIVEIVELGAIIIPSKDAIQIVAVTPPDQRPEEYRDADLRADDIIMAINGRSVVNIDTLKMILGSVKPGDEVRLALKRSGRPVMAKYIVASAEKRKSIMAANENRSIQVGEESSGGALTTRRMVRIAGDEAMTPWIDLGVMLSDSEGGVSVSQKIEMASAVGEAVKLDSGDKIISLQGRMVSSASQLMAEYEKITVGENVTLTISRGGTEKEFSFAKPKAPAGGVRVIKREK